MNEIIHDGRQSIRSVDCSGLSGKMILVTGATGLIGTHLLAVLARLKQIGMPMTIFGHHLHKPSNHTIEIAKLGDIHLTRRNLNQFRPDITIHAAGYAQPVIFTENPAETIRINTTWTHHLLSHNKPDGKFLFISSSEVYSGLGGLVTESAIGTTTPSHPRSCYIEGKRCGEALVNAYRKDGLDAKSVRLSLAYGPGTRKHDKRAMSQFIEQALTDKRIDLKYSGRESRTFCYISDAIEMIFQVLLHGKHPVYNVGGESRTNMAGVAETIAGICKVPLHIPESETELDGAPLTVSMDLTRVKTEFHKTNFVSLEDGLKRTIDWNRGLYECI